MREAMWCFSAIDERHHRLGVAFALSCARRKKMIDLREFVRGQRDAESAKIVFEIPDAFGTRDRHNVIALSNHPRQRELCGRAALCLGKVFHMRRKLKISLEGLSLEAGIRVPPIVGGEVGWLLNGPS